MRDVCTLKCGTGKEKEVFNGDGWQIAKTEVTRMPGYVSSSGRWRNWYWTRCV